MASKDIIAGSMTTVPEHEPLPESRGAPVLHVTTPPMKSRFTRTVLLAAALVAAAWAAHSLPASRGGLMPAALLGIGVTARELRRRTSPESKRA